MNELDALGVFALSVGIGLLLGLERERRPQAKAGLRTFALTALLGTGSALIAQQAPAPWLLPVGLLACALMMIAADRQSTEPADTTTTIALLLCFTYGAMLWHGHTRLTVALALATTSLLYFKTELHEVSHKLSRQDIVSFLQFAVITFIVLPLLPDTGYGPYQSLNPYRIWLIVVLIAGIGLAGYVALRLRGTEGGAALLGVLGGLISSTATTLVFARKVREEPDRESQSAFIVLIANLVLLVRLAFLATVLAPGALPSVAPMLALGMAAGVIVPLRLWRLAAGHASTQELPAKNPVELVPALSFGAIYAGSLVLTAWLSDAFGTKGIYALAPVLGLTDMDAITLSSLKLFNTQQLSGRELAIAIALALASNLIFKASIAGVVGGAVLARRIVLGFACVLAGLAAGVAIA
ncbi:MAG TPA: MgtC/SapB family protein [Nevskiaceae bacterium]|nr:MgtC/SapB family protein [Nevskiaceae bacterium]